jgi:hypothetical protein
VTPSRAARALAPLALAATVSSLGAGCTFQDGRGFATVSGRIWSRFAALDAKEGRLLDDGWLSASNGCEYRPSKLTLELVELDLLGAGARAGGADAGTAAEAGGAELTRLPVLATHDLTGTGTQQDLESCSPSCELSAGSLDGVELRAQRLSLVATLRDRSSTSAFGGKQPTLRATLDLSGAPFDLTLDSPEAIDRDHAQTLAVATLLPLTYKLLDGITWSTLARDTGGASITIDGAHNAAAAKILAASAASSAIQVSVDRSED